MNVQFWRFLFVFDVVLLLLAGFSLLFVESGSAAAAVARLSVGLNLVMLVVLAYLIRNEVEL